MNESMMKKTSGNQSTLKTMKILEILAANGEPMRLHDISISAEMNTSTTLRFINSLVKSGYVYQEKTTEKYMLTLKIISLSEKSNVYNRMKTILKDVLVNLAESCNESVCLAINQGDEVLYLDFVDGPSRILKATQRIGHQAPLYCTGVGKLHLLNFNSHELKALSDKGMQKLTENTITSLSELQTELDKIRKEMWAIDDEECETGLRCVAAPIIDNNGKVVAALSVTGPTGRIIHDRIEEIKKATISAAKKSAKLLGY